MKMVVCGVKKDKSLNMLAIDRDSMQIVRASAGRRDQKAHAVFTSRIIQEKCCILY